jgi:hypothetical protein
VPVDSQGFFGKDAMYELLKEPTREKFRDFIKTHSGEHNEVDFKQEWIDRAKLAKLMMAMANNPTSSLIVFGVKENDDHSFSPIGLAEIMPPDEVAKNISKLIPENLKYDISQFEYEGSEYLELVGKKFQIMRIESHPEFMPYITRHDAEDLEEGRVYVRRGTQCVSTNSRELESLINMRIDTKYSSTAELTIEDELQQLRALFGFIEPRSKALLWDMPNTMEAFRVPNPHYPAEGFDEFIANLIGLKKRHIAEVLGLDADYK